ncbi:MAG: acyltransferase [Lachnospiraceae bacterium]|nr:acyltransferase [Lachnospiraceae bacterium]
MDAKDICHEKQRITYVDAVKGFAIIFIVIQHAITNNPDIWQINQIYLLRFITQMAMPAFFFVNGFLYSRKYAERPVWGILRKIKAYYIPFVGYNFFFLICNNLFVKLYLQNDVYGDGWYGAADYIKHAIAILTGHREHMGGAMWFLRSILVISVIFIVADSAAVRIKEGKYRHCTLGFVTLMIVTVAGAGLLPGGLSNFRLEGIFFFYMGFLAKEYDWNSKLQKGRMVWLLLCAAICLSGSLLFAIGVARTTFVEEVLYLVLGCAGIAFLFLCAQTSLVEKFPVIAKIGSYSLEIMCLHFLAFKVVSIIMIILLNLPLARLPEYPVIMYIGGGWWLLYTAVGIWLPCIYASILTKCRSKIKTLAK